MSSGNINYANRLKRLLFIKKKREEFLERAGLYLLYAYIASLLLNPFIMLVIGMDKFSYVKVESLTGEDEVYFTELSERQREYLNKYRIISPAEEKSIAEFSKRIEWVSITALLGWVATSPGWARNLPKIVKKIRNELKKEKIGFPLGK